MFLTNTKSNEIQFIVPDIELLGPAPVIVINPDGQQSNVILIFRKSSGFEESCLIYTYFRTNPEDFYFT